MERLAGIFLHANTPSKVTAGQNNSQFQGLPRTSEPSELILSKNAADSTKNSAPVASTKDPPLEKFEMVTECPAEFLSHTNSPSKIKAGQNASSAGEFQNEIAAKFFNGAPGIQALPQVDESSMLILQEPQDKVAADKTGKKTADDKKPLVSQLKSWATPAADISIPAANTMPVAAEPMLATVTAAFPGNVIETPANLPAGSKPKSTGVISISFAAEKFAAELTAVATPLSSFFGKTVSTAAAEIEIANFTSAPANDRKDNSLKDSFAPAQMPAPATNNVSLPKTLAPVTGEETSSGLPRLETQSFHDGPAPDATSPESKDEASRVSASQKSQTDLPPVAEKNAVLALPEKIGNEMSVAKPIAGMAETQKQPAIIAVMVGPARPVAEATPVSDPPRLDGGTAVAQQDTTMKMASKKTNFSGSQQKLPGTATVATGENLPASLPRVAASAPIKSRGEQVLPVSTGIPANNSTAKMDSPETMNLPRVAPASVPFIQRTQELLSFQVMRLHEVGADEMRVVVRPDTGLQLSLHLQQRNGGVEVQAVLDRGNFGLLNRHWPELQQQLESRGVRVAPLADADSSFGGGSEGFRQPTTPNGQHAGDDADPAEMPAVLLPGLPPATATASASGISSRHLETWA